MMIKLIFLIPFALLSGQIFSQSQKRAIFRLSEYSQKSILLPDPNITPYLSKSFSRIIVEDSRCDTSIIGFNSKTYFTVNSLSKKIEKYINTCFTPKDSDTTNTLIIFIKKLWITNQLQPQRDEWIGGILWKTECFYK